MGMGCARSVGGYMKQGRGDLDQQRVSIDRTRNGLMRHGQENGAVSRRSKINKP